MRSHLTARRESDHTRIGAADTAAADNDEQIAIAAIELLADRRHIARGGFNARDIDAGFAQTIRDQFRRDAAAGTFTRRTRGRCADKSPARHAPEIPRGSAIAPPLRRTPCPGIASASTCAIGPLRSTASSSSTQSQTSGIRSPASTQIGGFSNGNGV